MPHARAVAPAVHPDLHMLTSSRTEARKQAQAEEEYYNTFEHQQGDSEQRRASDDSLKTAYTAEDTIPASAHRGRPELSSQYTNITASAPTDNPLGDQDFISTFTDY